MNFYEMLADPSNKFISVEKCLSGSMKKRVKCSECGALYYQIDNTEDVQLLLFEKGRIFPDCMLIGSSTILPLFSSRAIQVFQEAGLLNNLEIVKAELIAKPELKVPIPEENKYYYFLNAKGHAKFDFVKMGLTITGYCPECDTTHLEKWPSRLEHTYLLEESWDGSHFFLYGYCTENVLRAVYENKLTGFYFRDLLYSWDAFNQTEVNLKELFKNK